jgi:hypothetical protein
VCNVPLKIGYNFSNLNPTEAHINIAYTGLFLMFSVITNIYKKKTKGRLMCAPRGTLLQ